MILSIMLTSLLDYLNGYNYTLTAICLKMNRPSMSVPVTCEQLAQSSASLFITLLVTGRAEEHTIERRKMETERCGP